MVRAEENRRGFIATVGGAPAGLVDLELRAGVVSMSVYIRPDRNQHHDLVFELDLSAE